MDTFHPEIQACLAEDAKQRRANEDRQRAAAVSKRDQDAAQRANEAYTQSLDARLTGTGA